MYWTNSAYYISPALGRMVKITNTYSFENTLQVEAYTVLIKQEFI